LTTHAQRRRAYAAWITIAIVWGTTYLAIKIALETIPPFLMGGIRYGLAGLALVAFVALTGRGLPDCATWARALVSGGLLLGVGNGGVIWAEKWVATGLAAVLVAATPFWMVGLEAAIGGERLTGRSVAGLSIGFAGIVWLVWPDLMASLDSTRGWGFALGIAALQLAAIGWSLGSSFSRRHAPAGDPLGAAAAQMICGGGVMLTAGTLIGEWSSLAFTTRTFQAMAYLIVVGSLVGFVCYVYALHHLPTSFVALYAYVNPIVAVALGAAVLGERVGWRLPMAVATILSGMAVVSWQRPALPREHAAGAATRARAGRSQAASTNPAARHGSHDPSSPDQANEEENDRDHE
jgi:drug/metabolite transporter (DMT)-like permease